MPKYKTKRNTGDDFTQDYGNPITTAIHMAIKPLDKAAHRAELTWGADRLPSLVEPATAAKFGSAKAKLDQAIINNDEDEVIRRASVLIRGYERMNEEAKENGYSPLKPSIWSHTTTEGFKFAVAQGNADAIKAIRTDPALEGVAVYSLDEIGRILENQSLALVNSIKNVFPDSKVTTFEPLNDEVPF